MSACQTRPDAPNTLFDIGDSKTTSHIFEVKPGEVWAIAAFGLMDGDEIAVELVSGCGLGDMFECYRSASCGCPVVLDCNTHRVVIPYTGRYRLNITTGSPGDYRVMAFPTSDVGFTEGGHMACGRCGEKTAAQIVDEIAASPSALAGMCASLRPCIEGIIDQRVVNPATLASIVTGIAGTPTLVAALFDALAPAIAAAAHNNPAAFALLEDAFGADLGYAFPL